MVTVIDHGDWELYTPPCYPSHLPPNILFCRRVSDKRDWYDLVHSGYLDGDSVKMTVYKLGDDWIVQAVNTDPQRLWPVSQKLLELRGDCHNDPQAYYGQRRYHPDRRDFGIPVARQSSLVAALARELDIPASDLSAALTAVSRNIKD